MTLSYMCLQLSVAGSNHATKANQTNRSDHKWDWNKDLAGPVYDPFTGQVWPAGFNQMTLHSAFQKLLANRVFDVCENMFQSITLVKPTFTPEMEKAFETAKQGISAQERATVERELAETEERAARLRCKLGKTK